MALIFVLPTTSNSNVMNLQTCNWASKQHILFTYFLTYCLEQGLSSPGTLWNPKVHYCIYKSLVPLPILSQINPVHDLSHSLKIHLLIILPPMPASFKRSLSLRFSHQNFVYTSPLLHMCYIHRLFHSSQFDHPNNIWWGIRIIKLLIMFSPLPCYLIPLRPKYSP